MSEDFTDLIEKRVDRFNVKRMKAFRQFAALNNSSGSYLDAFEQDVLRAFMRSILEAVLYDLDINLNDQEMRYRKLLMQCLVNAANRSAKLRSCVDEYSEVCIRTLLKLDWLQNESFAAVNILLSRQDRVAYYQIVGYLCDLWGKVSDDLKKCDAIQIKRMSPHQQQQISDEVALANVYEKRSWILAIFANCLEHNDHFLADCNAIFKPSYIMNFVDIIITLIELEEHKSQVSNGNLKFLPVFIAETLKTFGTFEKVDESKQNDEGCVIYDVKMVLGVFAALEMILKFAEKEKYRIILAETTVAELVLYVIEGLLHHDYHEYQKEADTHICENSSSDRPKLELLPRSAANVCCVRNFAKALLSFPDKEKIEVGKAWCLRLISYLSITNDLNREFFGRNDAISILLRCMYIRDGQCPLTRFYAILAMRDLVLGYSPNQLRLAQLSQEPSAIVDRDGLLSELGLRAVYDKETKKIRLESTR